MGAFAGWVCEDAGGCNADGAAGARDVAAGRGKAADEILDIVVEAVFAGAVFQGAAGVATRGTGNGIVGESSTTP